MDNVGLDFVTDYMTVHFNWFGSFVENQIVGNVNDRFIVTIYGNRFWVGYVKISEEIEEPLNLASSIGQCLVFSFRGRSQNHMLCFFFSMR